MSEKNLPFHIQSLMSESTIQVSSGHLCCRNTPVLFFMQQKEQQRTFSGGSHC
jgi:hypothetical protein